MSQVPFASTTLIVNVYEPALLGVPEMAPVEVFRLNPGGSEPDASENVKGPVPPVIGKVAQ